MNKGLRLGDPSVLEVSADTNGIDDLMNKGLRHRQLLERLPLGLSLERNR